MEHDKNNETLVVDGEIFAHFDQHSATIDEYTKHVFFALVVTGIVVSTFSAVFALITAPFLF